MLIVARGETEAKGTSYLTREVPGLRALWLEGTGAWTSGDPGPDLGHKASTPLHRTWGMSLLPLAGPTGWPEPRSEEPGGMGFTFWLTCGVQAGTGLIALQVSGWTLLTPRNAQSPWLVRIVEVVCLIWPEALTWGSEENPRGKWLSPCREIPPRWLWLLIVTFTVAPLTRETGTPGKSG